MSSAVIATTGDAVSRWICGISEPVTVTISSSVGVSGEPLGGCCCAAATVEYAEHAKTLPIAAANLLFIRNSPNAWSQAISF